MFPQSKYIYKILLVALLAISSTSCTHWHDAKAVVAEADSLLVEGVIIRDTAALSDVINALENPLGRMFARGELTKAYYLMGRNLDDYHHNFSDAADFYIKADRMKTKDWILRGRINSCMGFICKQDSCFAEALEFYERACEAHQKSDNTWYYAHNLLNVAEQYVNLGEYNKVDSVLLLASNYDVDSAYYARMVDVHALSLYNQQLYDLALVHLLSIKEYPRNIEARCYSYQLIMHCYEFQNQLIECPYYAQHIINNSKNPSFRSNAYFFLMCDAKNRNAVEELARHSTCREDEDRNLQHVSESYAQASAKLRDYLNNPYSIHAKEILIILFCVIVIAIWAIWYSRKITNRKIASEKKLIEQEIAKWKEGILQKMHEEMAISEIEKRKMILNVVMNYVDEFAIDKPIWDNNTKLFRLADSCFGFIIYRLKHTYHLRNSELKICLMVLLDFPNKEIARIVSYKEDSYPTIKRRLATKLGTSASEMRNFLLDLIVKIL